MQTREIVKLGLILLLITSIAAFILSVTNDVTQAIIIEKAELANKESLMEIFTNADDFVKLEEDNIKQGFILEAYEALQGDQAVGYSVKTSTTGYGGAVVVLTAFAKEGEIIHVSVVSQSETPGLGDPITKDSFTGMFVGKDASTAFNVVKGGGSGDGDIQSLSGATISSKAVSNGVNAARTLFLDVLKNR
jgi:Na+-translocating ferredoxin:NAD+ oxidoreductase subunit G